MFKRLINYATATRKRMAAILSAVAVPLICASGVTAIEFAIITPILMLLFMGVIEFSIIMYASGVLDGATVAGARAGRTGYPVGGDRQAYIYGILKGRASGIMDPSLINITSKSYNDYTDVSPLDPCVVDDATCSHELGTARSVVVYTTSYAWPVVTPGLAQLIGDNKGNFNVKSTAIVKNEPWDGGSGMVKVPEPFVTPAPTLPPPVDPVPTPAPGSPVPESGPAPTLPPGPAPTPAPYDAG